MATIIVTDIGDLEIDPEGDLRIKAFDVFENTRHAVYVKENLLGDLRRMIVDHRKSLEARAELLRGR